MKKLLVVFLSLAFVMAACAPAAPQPAPAPTSEPQVVVVTVEVPAAAPTEPPAVQATAVPPTAVPPTDAPTAVPATDVPPTDAPTAVPTATSQPAVGGATLAEFTRSGDNFSLKCSPSELTLSVKAINPYIKKIELYYTMTDQLNNVTSQPFSLGYMDAQGGDVYTKVVSALDVNPDVRFDKAWFNYQFVGLNKTGDVVGRSDMFTKQVVFTLNCP